MYNVDVHVFHDQIRSKVYNIYQEAWPCQACNQKHGLVLHSVTLPFLYLGEAPKAYQTAFNAPHAYLPDIAPTSPAA